MRQLNLKAWIIGLMLSVASAGSMPDVVTVVSAKSPITALSRNQVADIFLGKITHYPNGVQAVPIDQEEGSAERDNFYDKIAGRSAAQIKGYWSKIIFTGRGRPPPTVSSGSEMKKRIVENPAAIGYIDRTLVDGSVRVVF